MRYMFLRSRVVELHAVCYLRCLGKQVRSGQALRQVAIGWRSR